MAAHAKSLFHTSIESMFNSWTALQLAVTHGLGGPHSVEKMAWMVDATEQWFKENDGIEPWELEEFLAVILSQEFDTVVDDGSLQQIATDICGYFRLCSSGKNDDVLERIRRLKKPALDRCVQETCEDSDEEEKFSQSRDPPHPSQVAHDVEEMSIDESENTSEGAACSMEEDDGWEVVQRKGKRK